MKGGVEDDGGHDPGEPDGHGHSHEGADELGFAVVVPEMPRFNGQTRYEQDQENDVEQGQQMVPRGVAAQRAAAGQPLYSYNNLKRKKLNEYHATFIFINALLT